MPGPRIVVGDVEVVSLSDAIVDYPWPLAELFPGVPDEAWAPFRARYPAAFGAHDGVAFVVSLLLGSLGARHAAI